ncbi:MAG: mechanosensitive ion channel family protein [Treponema sp.]|nr:mechanosensitive ion channel family protein [Treponema sp.]
MNEENGSAVAETVQQAAQATVETVAEVTQGVAKETRSMLHIDDLLAYFTWANILHVVTSLLAILIFYVAYRLLRRLIKQRALVKVQPHTAVLVSKSISYVFWALMVMYVLSLFGINLQAVWGAAGVAGLAIGFAAQTSVSNIISGVFVLSEKAMKIGDYISVGDVNGVVDSVNLLSVRVHTLDNQMVRIPNSSIINGTLTNYNYFDKRRLVFSFPVPYEADMEKVLEAVGTVPSLCPSVVQDPAPAVFYDGFGDDGITMKLAVWFNRTDFIKVKNEGYINIVKVCRDAGFEIPFTHLDVNFYDADKQAAAKKKAASSRRPRKSAEA